jgi:peptidoglycan/LPS O-acetylase OafA/YrhL
MVVKRNSRSIPAVILRRRAPAKPIELDTLDTTVLKGLAISAIVLHNFFHAVSPARENEFEFHPGGFAVFLHTVSQPSLALQAIFSFFGYLGVPIFIFLSAYGLSKSHWDDPASWTRFMAGRLRKLFPLFGLIILPWTLVIAFQIGSQPFLHSVLPQVACLFTGLTPLLPGLGLPPIGPWWFIPFILEFYAVFFLLRALTKEFGWPGLVALGLLGVAATSISDPFLAHWGINLYETPFGRLPSVCLGIAAARYPFRVPASLVVASGAVLVLGNEFRSLWSFTFTAALLLALWAYMAMRGNLRECRTFELIGRYSILIFLVNGIVRDDLLSFATTPLLQLLFGAISAAASFTVAALLQEFLFPQRSVAISNESLTETPEAESLPIPPLPALVEMSLPGPS